MEGLEGSCPPQPRQPPAEPQPPRQLHLRLGCPLLPPSGAALERRRPGQPQSPWERQSRPLAVGAEAKAALRQLADFMQAEAAALGDDTLQQEVALLRRLAGAA